MLRRLIVRALCAVGVRIAVRVVAVPCAVWFGKKVLVVAPGVGLFLLTPEDARTLAEKLYEATRPQPQPKR